MDAATTAGLRESRAHIAALQRTLRGLEARGALPLRPAVAEHYRCHIFGGLAHLDSLLELAQRTEGLTSTK